MTPYKKFQQYFSDLGNEMEGIKSVVFVSNWEEIMELQLNSAEYPALVVETPDIEIADLGGSSFGFESACAVIKNTPKDETRSFYHSILDEISELTLKVFQKIHCDADVEDIIESDLQTILNPVIKATADNCYGWRGSFKISNIQI